MIRFQPLPGFGIEAEGVDLSAPLADDEFRALEQKFYEHHVLALRGQQIDAARFAAFARRIGPPQPHVIDQFHHPDDPNILILSNVKKDGKPTGLQDAGSYFHTTTRTSRCRRARPRSIRASCRKSAATPCSPTSRLRTTICRRR